MKVEIEDLDIRDIEIGDVEQIVDLERKSFRDPWPEAAFRREIGRGWRSINLMATLGGRPVGFLLSHVSGREVHMIDMAVDPRLRRMGLGTALLNRCLARSRKRWARRLILEVREKNLGAREFYRSFGFAELRKRRGYYVDTGEDALVMALDDIRTRDEG